MFPEQNAADDQSQNDSHDVSQSVFNDQNFSLGNEDDDYQFLAGLGDQSATENSEEQTQQAAPAAQATPAADTQQAQEENAEQAKPGELVFDDEKPKDEKTAVELSKEDMIKKLEAEGFKVEKSEDVQEDVKVRQEVEQLDNVINNLSGFLTKDDDVTVKTVIRHELSVKYSQSGREHLIGKEEFNIDLDAEMAEYESSPTVMKLKADNIRRDIKEALAENTGKRNGIIAEQQKKTNEQIAENRNKLQESFKAINAQKLFGAEVPAEICTQAYKSIVSGEFAKQVQDDPSLAAEFAIYRLQREEITKRLGGPTYGEGVKAAIDAIQGGKNESGKSPLANAVGKHANSGASGDPITRNWGPEVVEVPAEQKNENKKVIGG